MSDDSYDSKPLVYASAPLRLNLFNVNNPRVWFHQVESVFNTRRITSQRDRFSYVVEALPDSVASEVLDVLDNVPPENPYEVLKSTIIKRTAASDSQTLRQLFTTLSLGDRKPSQLLRQMRTLLGNRHMDESILRQLWLEKLPLDMQKLLAAYGHIILDSLAENADNIAEVYHSPAAYAVQPSSSTSVSTDQSELRELRQMVTSLTHSMASLTSRFDSFRNSRSPSRSRSRSPSSSSTRKSLCWYHFKYGAAARKCNPPCSFSSDQASLNAQARQ